ncbi:SDR family oxidoreductase [Congregibacter brevis]|uniref:SDR family oxidoreductase n=1 Tax=Congregibacter brevis TaxID=3081201 RepID=A0ABZ0ICX8_9GAMM|nr:SDR family oxidoreductase [Congregibacter sp. IMCC45268]
MPHIITLLLSCLLSISLFAGAVSASTQAGQKAVLVTGASSGIGKQIALTLAERGFFVYAGARKARDIEALSAVANIQGIRLDVTLQDEIDAAVNEISQGGRGLYGLVNNAGVFLFDPLIEVTERDMQFIMDVNVFGPYRVTKAFAPLLIENQGRITTTGSIAGLFSGQLMGPYAMSKHAIEGFTDSLAAELAKFDVQVSVVEPGNFRSDIMKNMQRRIAEIEDGERSSLYEDEIKRFASFTKADRSQQAAPIPVADAVYEFMTSETPKRRYLVAPNANEAHYAVSRALRRIVELNEGQLYSQSADDLARSFETLLLEGDR